MKNRTQFYSFVFFLILFILLPLSISLLVAFQILDDSEKHEIELLGKKLLNQNQNILTDLEPASFNEKPYNEFSATASASNFKNKDEIFKAYDSVCAKYETKFEFAIFDDSGEILFHNGVSPDLLEVFIYLWEYKFEVYEESNYKAMRAAIAKVMGKRFHPQTFRNTSKKVISSWKSNKQNLLYSMEDPNSLAGVLIFSNKVIPAENLIPSYEKNYGYKLPTIAYHSKNTGYKIFPIDQNTDPESLIQKMTSENSETLLFNDMVWAKRKTDTLTLVIGEKFDFLLRENLKKGILLFSSILAIVLAFILFRIIFMKSGIWISIRYKLVAIFIFTVYFPLAGLYLLSTMGLENRRQVLENDALKSIKDLLYKIDSDFSKKENEILHSFEKLFNDRSWQGKNTNNWTGFDSKIKEIIGVDKESKFFNWLNIRGPSLEQIFSSSRGSSDVRFMHINKSMAQICLEKFCPEVIDRKKLNTSQAEIIMRSFMENPVIGFTHFFEVPGKLVQMEFEGADLYWYWNYYSPPVNGVAYFGGNTRATYNAMEYIEDSLKERFSLGNAALRIFAYSSFYKKWTPESIEISDQIEKMVSASKMETRIVSSTIPYQNDLYLATCFPGIKLRDVYLVCLFPVEEISGQIFKLRNQIGVGAILILCFSILTGLLLTETFLMPIAELQTGLEALRRRDSDHRVHIENKDELGELGQTFNQMMEEVKEMLLAAAVQQCLIPQSLPEVEGYQIDLFNHMATDVGGDYADFFELPDKKYLLVLGDVTGHGVSSSILTAMVKAMVFKFSRKSPDLPTTLKAISHMIFDLLKHRKLMTFCAVILDPANNEFYLSNAGHPFPFLCSTDNQFKPIEHESLPLGVSKKRSVYTVTKGNFKQGDVLILYTDGIAEAASPTGEILGFDTIAKMVCKNIEKEPQKIREALVDEFFNHTQSSELEDDLTTVIIKRV